MSAASNKNTEPFDSRTYIACNKSLARIVSVMMSLLSEHFQTLVTKSGFHRKFAMYNAGVISNLHDESCIIDPALEGNIAGSR